MEGHRCPSQVLLFQSGNQLLNCWMMSSRQLKEDLKSRGHLASGILILQALISSLFQSDLEVKRGGGGVSLENIPFPNIPGGFSPARWSPHERPKPKESFDPVVSLRPSLSQSLHPYVSTDKSTNLGLAGETSLSQALLAAPCGGSREQMGSNPSSGTPAGAFSQFD